MTPTDIDCELALRRLFDFLDHELDGEDREAMQRHLQACRACYSRAAFEQRLKGKLRELASEEPAVDARERLERLLRDF